MSEWISVADRLPPMNWQVIAVDEYGEIDIGHYFEGYYGLFFSSPREIAKPTHWMEMPEGPNGSGKISA